MAKNVDHIAIVGCGFTGVSALYQLLRDYPVRRISVFEATGTFGPGFPYAVNESADYLINNTTDTMCLAPDNRRAFLDWLESHPELGADLAPKGHLPRNFFGLFLKDMFAGACNRAEALDVTIDKIPHEVTAVEETSEGVKLHSDDGELIADAVIMATGRCPGKTIVGSTPKNREATYISSHICCDEIDEITLDANVHILGASLSAYDIINRLYSEKTGCKFTRDANGDLKFEPGRNNRHVALCSRSGRLKKMQSRAPGALKRDAFTRSAMAKSGENGLTLSQIAEAIQADAKLNDKKVSVNEIRNPYGDCQTIDDTNRRAGDILAADIEAAKKSGKNFLVDLFENAQIEMWDTFRDRLLSSDDERLYREKYETALFAYSAPCPIPTAERVLALIRAGRLNIITGTGTPRLSETGKFFEIPHSFGIEPATVVIDAAGKVDRDVTSNSQPAWVQHMQEKGTLAPYFRDGQMMSGADIDMHSFRPRGAKNIYFANMYLWGPGLFTSSAFIMATVVSRILRVIFQK